MPETLVINQTIGNEWGWFIDFVDDVEIVDELLKPQVTYSRISCETKQIPPKIKETTVIKNKNNCNYIVFPDVPKFILLTILYKIFNAFCKFIK